VPPPPDASPFVGSLHPDGVVMLAVFGFNPT
jgi:hypothetical protein